MKETRVKATPKNFLKARSRRLKRVSNLTSHIIGFLIFYILLIIIEGEVKFAMALGSTIAAAIIGYVTWSNEPYLINTDKQRSFEEFRKPKQPDTKEQSEEKNKTS